jgi:ComF family protein
VKTANACRSFRRLFRALERELLPPRCVFCGVETCATRRRICRGCNGELVHNQPACRACALPLPGYSDRLCGSCQQGRSTFRVVLAPYIYAFPLDAAIKAFKFRQRLWYAPAFAELLKASLPALPPGIDAVQPVPLHRWRQMTRGFNQARELAAPVAAALKVPLVDKVRRCRNTPYQSGLSRAERRRNLVGAFRLRGRIESRHVLLVDDVVTTAATCRQIASLLRRHGVREVSVLALARALAPDS